MVLVCDQELKNLLAQGMFVRCHFMLRVRDNAWPEDHGKV
jgi:hypothetical protein